MITESNRTTATNKNKDLAEALQCIKNAREALDVLTEDSPFHNETWKQAFYGTLDHMDALKDATPRDAATLGIVYIQVLDGLVNQIIELPENNITLADLCYMWTSVNSLDRAKFLFEYMLSDFYGSINEDGTLAGQPATFTHKLRFPDFSATLAAQSQLAKLGFTSEFEENELELTFTTEEELDEGTRELILEKAKTRSKIFNIMYGTSDSIEVIHWG